MGGMIHQNSTLGPSSPSTNPGWLRHELLFRMKLSSQHHAASLLLLCLVPQACGSGLGARLDQLGSFDGSKSRADIEEVKGSLMFPSGLLPASHSMF